MEINVNKHRVCLSFFVLFIYYMFLEVSESKNRKRKVGFGRSWTLTLVKKT